MPLNFRRRHRFSLVQNRLNDTGTMFGGNFGKFPGRCLGGYYSSQIVRQALDDISGADDVIGVSFLPTPLLPAILLKSAVFSLVKPQVADFRQRQAHFHKGLFPARNGLFQLHEPLRLPDAHHLGMIFHIRFCSSRREEALTTHAGHIFS